jgi:uncharacterized protein
MESPRPAHFREKRFYRDWMKSTGLFRFDARVMETDLAILAERDLTRDALARIVDLRNGLQKYAESHDGFLAALEPVKADADAPEVVKRMCRAALSWEVGPMAAVAGAFAEMVGEALLARSKEVIVENGGDIFIATRVPRDIGIYAGPKSPFLGKLTVQVRPDSGIRGVCTSSGTVGHSLSRGKADAVVTFASSAAYADAAATAIGNRIQTKEDVDAVIEAEKDRDALLALVIVIEDRMGAFGEIEFM